MILMASSAVTLGGVIGLFLGASILSFIEVLFLIADIFKKRYLIAD